MDTFIGEGDFRYRVAQDWPKLPDGWELHEVADVGVMSDDTVFLFCRGNHPVIEVGPDGAVRGSWGHGQFHTPHAVFVAPDDTLYLTDDGLHAIMQYTRDGRLLRTIGVPGHAAPFMSNQPFNRPTQIAFTPTGDMLISDGYGNGCVHKYNPDGKYIKTWGRCGSGPGEFNIVHYLVCDADGIVYVADRENHRIQLFDSDGRYLTQWNNLHRPAAMCMVGSRKPAFVVGELGPALPYTREYPNLGPRLSVVDYTGTLLMRLGARRPGLEPDAFIAPHGMSINSRGDIFVGEVSVLQWIYWPGVPCPPNLRCFRKLEKV